MKRVFSILLCLALMFSVTACKPDNITYPTDIVDPNEAAQDADKTEQTEEPAGEEESTEEKQEETTDETADESTDDETAGEPTDQPEENPDETVEETTEEITDETAEQATDDPIEEVAVTNPLAADDFAPAATVAGTLQTSGIVKPGAAVSALKNRTVTFYTADDRSAFSYTDENGKTVSELDWMEKLAKEQGFILKYQIKNSAVSLKSQRIALFAGQKLSLVQMTAGELGNGLTLATAADHLLNPDTTTYGISKAVLEQSNHKLFAPVGNVNTLWYNTALMPEGTDPQTLSTANQWTVEQFKTVCGNAAEGVLPLIMEELLPWATLSGRSPLTLLDGKLDSNLYAKVTRDTWSAVKALDLNTLRNAEGGNDYSLDKGSTLFAYTNAPQTVEGLTLKYAPLPALNEGTAGTVTFAGTFFALPKYETDTEAQRAALTFAELWCNRYTEARAAALQKLGVKGADYQTYCDMAENQGMLILYTPEIQKAAEGYLSGLTDPTVNMDAAYEDAQTTIEALIAARNLYYHNHQ